MITVHKIASRISFRIWQWADRKVAGMNYHAGPACMCAEMPAYVHHHGRITRRQALIHWIADTF